MSDACFNVISCLDRPHLLRQAIRGILRSKLHETLILLEYDFKVYADMNEINLKPMHAG